MRGIGGAGRSAGKGIRVASGWVCESPQMGGAVKGTLQARDLLKGGKWELRRLWVPKAAGEVTSRSVSHRGGRGHTSDFHSGAPAVDL